MMIKPDATARNLIGEIVARVEKSGLRVAELRKLHLSKEEAQEFYAVHKERPFYDSLCTFMSSGPIVAGVLEGDGAIRRWRELMGATNPAEAGEGTIRKDFAESIERNSVHGSDAAETAVFTVNLNHIRKGDLSTNIALRSGDIVYVPPNPFARVGYAPNSLLLPIQPFFGFLRTFRLPVL